MVKHMTSVVKAVAPHATELLARRTKHPLLPRLALVPITEHDWFPLGDVAGCSP